MTTEIPQFEMINVRVEAGKVAIITLNRPKQLNALNDQLMTELGTALKAFDADASIGCMIVTGSEKAFAAGADIGAMATCGNDHPIAHFGPTAQVDLDDIFGLVIVEGIDDRGQKRIACHRQGGGCHNRTRGSGIRRKGIERQIIVLLTARRPHGPDAGLTYQSNSRTMTFQ